MVGVDVFPIEIVPKNRGHSFVFGGTYTQITTSPIMAIVDLIMAIVDLINTRVKHCETDDFP